MKTIKTFQKEIMKIIEGKEVKVFEDCDEAEATHTLIRKPMKHRPYNQEYPSRRVKNDKSK